MTHQRRYLIGNASTWVPRSAAHFMLTTAGATTIENRLGTADALGTLRCPVAGGTVTIRSAWSDSAEVTA